MHNSDFWNSFKCYPRMECCQAITILFLVWKSRVSCTKTLQLSLTYIKVGSTKYIRFIMVWIKDFIYWFFGSIQRVLVFLPLGHISFSRIDESIVLPSIPWAPIFNFVLFRVNTSTTCAIASLFVFVQKQNIRFLSIFLNPQ